MTHIDRQAARVILLDASGRALLMHGGDPARPGEHWWFTPGGGLDPGETPAQAAARELFEETGLRVDPAELGEPVHHEVTEFSLSNRDYRQSQHFFTLRVPTWEVSTAGFDADERQRITGHRWWSAPDIEASTEQIFPLGLATLIRRLTPATPPAPTLAAGASSSTPGSSVAGGAVGDLAGGGRAQGVPWDGR